MSRIKRRIYLSVIGVCAAALLVDRLLLRESVTEPATVDAAIAVPPKANSTEAGPTGHQPIPELPFPPGLVPIESTAGFRDIFSPADNSFASDGDSDPHDTASASTSKSARASFVAEHRLEAVMEDGGLRIVIVNGTWLRPGQSLSGCELTAVEGTRASFACDDGEAVLILAGAEPGTRR